MIDLDPVIHERARLEILSYLMLFGEMNFKFLKEKTGLTDGNLAQHLRKLEDAGYITVTKTFKNRRPHTTYKLSERGLEAFKKYLKDLKNFLTSIEKGG